ncbi:DNA polymerase/3'-5' exonuclease PolX [Planctomycetales bacterium ZRK34]|nr:DNA polymerase/3'-5' exonuclease PolX [Planctomycetales bacterium ZRK34]
MSTNAQLAEQFDRMAQVLQLLGANRFRVAAYERGSRTLEELSQDVAELADDTKQLTAIDGIGKGLAEHIAEYVKTGKIQDIEDAVEQVPPGVIELLNIPGLGPKGVKTLWEQGGVESIEVLKQKIETGELEKLPRMGAKTIENLKKSIAFAESSGDRVNIAEALPLAESIVEQMKQVKNVTQISYGGSLRRGRETIGDIDILIACKNPDKQAEAIAEHFRQMDFVQQVLAAGKTKSSVRTRDGMQIDLRIVRDDQYGAALLYFTGSKAHNIVLRERSIKMKLRLNEYGLFKEGDDKDTDKPLAAKTEADIYKKLKLAYIPPEMREDRGEVAAAEKNKLPKLVTLDDIKAELHAHTTASDGVWSIEELAEAAKARGFHTVAVTDHSQSQVIANGLDAKRLEKHIEAIHAAAKQVKGITILAGAEVDILSDGKLDYDDDLLAELDLVVASPHVALSQPPDKATKRLIKAIENPYVHILGHPTGRLVGKREGLSPDISAIIKAAADTGTALEINAHHMRLDLRDTHARAAIEAGVMLAIDCDAHGPSHLDELRYGILTARRAWAKPTDIINCMTAAKLKAWLKQKRNNV